MLTVQCIERLLSGAADEDWNTAVRDAWIRENT